MDLSVDTDQTTIQLKMNLGSGAMSYNAEYAFTNGIIQKRSIDVSTQLVDAITVDANAKDGQKYVQITLGEAKTAVHDFLIIDEVIKQIGEDDDKLVIRLFNAGQPVAIELMIRNGNDQSYVTKETMTLQTGMNSISLNNLYGFNWNKIKFIENLRIKVGEKGDAERNDIYFVDMALYKR